MITLCGLYGAGGFLPIMSVRSVRVPLVPHCRNVANRHIVLALLVVAIVHTLLFVPVLPVVPVTFTRSSCNDHLSSCFKRPHLC
jgi:hypothetical protein